MRYILLCILVAILISVMRWPDLVDAVTEAVRVNNSSSVCVNCTSTRTKVTNNNARSLLVPNATQAEFDAFKAKAPSLNVALGSCGGCWGVDNITVTHTAGTVAPVTKTVVYNITSTDIAGTGTKCWITQNLGADHEATAVNDATESSAGWYWQFNRKQGYKHDGTTRTPSTAWNNYIDESSNWVLANDPCVLSLGSRWRIPTSAEWTSATSGWANAAAVFASVLKLHQAGLLLGTTGALSSRGSNGCYWSSTQSSTILGLYLSFSSSGNPAVSGSGKPMAYSLRCLQDAFVCGSSLTVTHTAGSVAPVTKTVTYGTVSTNLTGSNKCWITRNLGATTQASSATDATEASAGWYWQFNLKQGYQFDVSRTPTPGTWNGSINEASDWISSNDPCTLLLGTGWRIPTRTEWTNADTGWGTVADAYGSGLNLHLGGDLGTVGNLVGMRGTFGSYWASTQNNNTIAWGLSLSSAFSSINQRLKSTGIPVRCLMD